MAGETLSVIPLPKLRERMLDVRDGLEINSGMRSRTRRGYVDKIFCTELRESLTSDILQISSDNEQMSITRNVAEQIVGLTGNMLVKVVGGRQSLEEVYEQLLDQNTTRILGGAGINQDEVRQQNIFYHELQVATTLAGYLLGNMATPDSIMPEVRESLQAIASCA